MIRLIGCITLIFVTFLFYTPNQGLAQVQGGTITYAAGADPDSLDSPNCASGPGEAIQRMVYDKMAQLDANLKVIPGLAYKWEQSKDGMTWMVYLRKGVKFHDGTPFTAEAIKICIDRLLGPEKPLWAGVWTPIVDSVQVVDDYTVKFNLKIPYGFFLNLMAHPSVNIYSPAAYRTYGKDLARHAVGTGPFKFVEWVFGDHITLVRNDDYWAGKPNIDKIIVKTVKEDSARAMMLQSGDAQLAVRIPAEDIPRLEKDPQIKITSFETLRVLYIGMNCLKKPFTDIRVRQALNYAIDRESIVKNLYQGRAVVSQNAVSPMTVGYAKIKGYPYDPEKAKKLLAEAGYPNGFKAKLWSPEGRYPKDYELAQAVQQQLQKVGVDCTLTSMEWAAYWAATGKPPEQSETELFLLGWVSGTAEARWVLVPLFATDQWAPRNNRTFFSNKEFDGLVDKFTAAPNPKERDKYLAIAQELISREAPIIPILVTKETTGMSKKLHGVVNSPIEITFLDYKAYLER